MNLGFVRRKSTISAFMGGSIALTSAFGLAAPSASALTVLPGQTLSGIASIFNTTVEAIAAANGIVNPNFIEAGQVLKLPADSSSGGTPQSVVLLPGQTLGQLASQFHISVQQLAALNGISDPNFVEAGWKIQLVGTPPAPSPAPAPVHSASLSGTVTVQPGQTLSVVAAEYGTTVSALQSANGLTDPNFVEAGQVLKLSVGPPSTQGSSNPAPAPAQDSDDSGTSSTPSQSSSGQKQVKVAPGQTLASIAQANGVTITDLASANGITNTNFVEAGQLLTIPAPGSAAASQSSGPTVTPTPPPASNQPILAANNTQLPPQLAAYPDRVALLPDFEQWASQYGVPAHLLEGLCWWESGWQASIVSVTGAIGVCQLEPYTVNSIETQFFGGKAMDAYDANSNIEMAAAWVHSLIQQAGGSIPTAVAAYYQGMGTIQKFGIYSETRPYVKGVMAYYSYFGG